jgi:hypothetical protein
MATLAGVLAFSTAASAITYSLIWAGSGTNVTGTNFTGSETLTLDLYVTFPLPPGLSGETVSVQWDDNALKLQSCAMAGTKAFPASPAWVAGGTFAPILGKSTCPTPSPGLQPALDQQAGALPYMPGVHTFLAAELVFHVTGLVTGNSVVSTFFRPGSEGWGDGDFMFSDIATHGSATVHVIPEPRTALLVACGFLGLIAAGRRRRQG